MPHMVTVDQWGFVWLTDVGLHQVFKFDPAGQLLLTLGQRLQPGSGASFCKPTQVGRDHATSAIPGYDHCYRPAPEQADCRMKPHACVHGRPASKGHSARLAQVLCSGETWCDPGKLPFLILAR